MTREEIKNTSEIVDFMLDKSVIADSRMKLHKRLEELCKLAIKALEQEPKWIPVSERLPKEFETVILSTDKDEVFIGDYWGKMNDGTDCFDDNDGMNWEGNVVAWMPLPQPYVEVEK